VTIIDKHSIEPRLPHSSNTGLVMARAHARSERTNDFDSIMATVSRWDSNFVILAPLPEGEFEFNQWLTPEGVDAFYESSLSRQDTLEQFPVNEINSSWHQFTEALGDLRYHSDGEIHQVHVAVLFPVWVDGILGEICWKAPEWAMQPFDCAQRVELTRQLEAFDDGWRAGDSLAMAATLGETAHGVIRIAEVDGARRFRAVVNTKDELISAWDAPEAGRVVELERVNQIITNWYVYASYRMLLDVSGRQVVRETALILPVGPDRKFLGELSYAVEVDA
jgi:hypothetical protein